MKWTLALATLAATSTLALGATATGAHARARTARSTLCLVPGTHETLDRQWRPDTRTAISYLRQRRGEITFGVRTRGSFYGFRADEQEWSASVLKPMLMVAYLDMPSVANRALTDYDRSLLYPMITRSDNDAADDVDEIVGSGRLDALAARVGMTHFSAAYPIWGESEITARDQTKFFLHIASYIPDRHRSYAMHLLASIVSYQRWGIGKVAPKGWKLYFKGGWGAGTGLMDHQVALLTRGCARVSIAVLTMYDGSHSYGKETLRAIFHRLLRGLPTGPHTRYR